MWVVCKEGLRFSSLGLVSGSGLGILGAAMSGRKENSWGNGRDRSISVGWALLWAFFGVFFGITVAIAAPGEPGVVLADGPLDLSDFPADYVDEVVLPVPGEILTILEKLGETGWKDEMRVRVRANFRDRTDYALALGVAVADGFIAVQAQDKEAVEVAGRAVLRHAEALGLRQAVTRHCQAIFDAGEAGDWVGVRRELDLTERTAREAMAKTEDVSLAAAVSLGGWVRGTEVASSVISKAFTADKAELLNQPDLVEHFIAQIAKADEKVKGNPKMSAIAEALGRVAVLMGEEDEPVPSDAAVEINEICKGVVDLILGTVPPPTGEKAAAEEGGN